VQPYSEDEGEGADANGRQGGYVGYGVSDDDEAFRGEGQLPAWGAEEEALFGGSEDDFLGKD
jgi:hypothetical protein